MIEADPRPRVLLVDDDPAMLRILAKSLETSGYLVEQTRDGAEALSVVEQRPPGFLITDWDMPRMDGVELCRRVRSLDLSNYVYILFVTGKTTHEDMIAGLEAGADDFLMKPVHRGELLARLRSGSRVLALERQLARQARTDLLTGISTRRSFLETCAREFDRARRYDAPLSCVMMDIDYFKRINDTLGHPTGDAVLREVAGTFAAQCRGSDFVCRYGGDEFAAILPETRESDAVIWAERVRGATAELQFVVGDETLGVTTSFGVAQALDDIENPDQLIDLADQALLVAKKCGRNRVVRYSSMQGAARGQPESATYEELFQGVAARDIMSSPVAALPEQATLAQAAEYFLRYRINSAPVVDAAGATVGILGEQDCIINMIARDAWTKPVAEVMSRNVVCYDEQTPLKVIYDFFCRVTLRRVIIVRRGEPVGVISRSTLMRWYQHWIAAERGWQAEQAPLEVLDRQGARQQIMYGLDALLQRVQSLRDRMQEQPEFVTPIIVSGTSQIQELCTDLLGYARGPSGDSSQRDLVTNFL